MSTSDVLKVLTTLRTFRTLRVTINPEIHEQVHTIFYLLYIQQNYSVAFLLRVARVRILQFFRVWFLFSGLCLPNIRPGLWLSTCFCFFSFSLSCSTMFWFHKANRPSAIIFNLVFKFGASQCFHGNFPIALYICH